MDFFGAIGAAGQWFTANWSTIEGLARSLAADLAAVWALGLALSVVLKPFFPGLGTTLEQKTHNVLGIKK